MIDFDNGAKKKRSQTGWKATELCKKAALGSDQKKILPFVMILYQLWTMKYNSD